MSTLKTRLVKLESFVLNETEQLRVAQFVVDPGAFKPIGYRCGDIKIMRCHDESEESFKQRCVDAVDWADCISHIFEPLYVTCKVYVIM